MKGKNYWTSQWADGIWCVKKAGTTRAASMHSTQAKAWKEAKRLARGEGAEALLIDRDGSVRHRNTYSPFFALEN